MDKFLGLPIVRKPLTDAEYVERARRDIQRWRRYGKWLALFQVALLALYGFILSSIASVLVKVGGNQIVGGLFLGIGLGMGFGVPILHSLHQFVNTFVMLKGDRTSQLLVKYHDALLELAYSEDDPTLADKAGEGRAGGAKQRTS